MKFIDNFKLKNEKEEHQKVNENILSSIDFKGTNLWILIFAIFIASLGLNVNSTAVIIGAMLVSPLMGPIMGVGYGMAINDIALLKRALFSYLFATGIGLATSTVFFLISPINDAHSEILSRISPSIYDVLIALFGGLAGILATSSKLKGNVIPGVAIATALMPPLCTAGYGIATLQLEFFSGALYLYFINSIFIAVATLLTIRFLKFPFKQLPELADQVRAKRVVWFLVLTTLLPSIYFGYDMVIQNRFEHNAKTFVEYEAIFPNNYLLNQTIDGKNKTITLTYGGMKIPESEIEKIKEELVQYKLDKANLVIRQGFSYMNEDEQSSQTSKLTLALNEKESKIQILQNKLDSIITTNIIGKQIFNEIKVQYPDVTSFVFQKANIYSDKKNQESWIAIMDSDKELEKEDKEKIEKWLKVRMNIESLMIYYNNKK